MFRSMIVAGVVAGTVLTGGSAAGASTRPSAIGTESRPTHNVCTHGLCSCPNTDGLVGCMSSCLSAGGAPTVHGHGFFDSGGNVDWYVSCSRP
jgi:hypothetical protein